MVAFEISANVEYRQAELDVLYKQWFPDETQRTDRKPEQLTPTLDDQRVIDLMHNARNGHKARQLWAGDITVYPSQSEADQGLCSIIAFYTQDPAQIDRIFRQSALYREKWDRADYRERTISRAVSSLTDTYRPAIRQEQSPTMKTGRDTDSQMILEALKSNEDGDAWLFIQKFEDEFCFDHSARQWFKWNGTYWEPDKVNAARAGIKAIIRLYRKEVKNQAVQRVKAIEKDDKEAAKECEKYEKDLLKRVRELQSENRKNHVLSLATDGPESLGISGDQWDRQTMWLPCLNGIIDLETGELFEAKPEHYVKTISPVEWKGLDQKADRWCDFLKEIFAYDHDVIGYAQRLFGYSITGKTTEHVYPIAWGEGRNGKGTLFEILGHVLGDVASPIEPEMILQQRFAKRSGGPSSDILFLRGKRLVWASEISEGRCLDTGKLKWLTGGDTLTGRNPYGRYQVTFRPTHKLFLLTNHKPHAPSNDFALWQRIYLVPFNLSFVDNPTGKNERQRDPDLPERLRTEASGILAWLVRGCLEWQRQGLNPPEIVKTATRDYRQDEDIIGQFIQDRCVIDDSSQLKAGDVYKAYQKWCDEMGHRAITGTAFGKEMKIRFDWHKPKNVYYIGLKLLV